MKTRFSLSFQLKQSKCLPNGTAPIYLRITIGDDRVGLSTKKYVLPERWNSAMQKVSGTGEDVRTINAYLKTMEQEVFQAHQALIVESKEVTGLLPWINFSRPFIIGSLLFIHELDNDGSPRSLFFPFSH